MPARDRPRHRRSAPAPAAQRGAALILLITVLVLGVAWFVVGALGKAAPTSADRDTLSGAALGQSKRALLAYVAQYAARSGTIEPGQMPCPEFLSSIGTGNQGQAGTSCSNASPTVGRLPWETLGVDEIRDGYGEPIWYVLSPGFRAAPINFGTPGQLTYNGNPNTAVALLIAPGPPLNTASDPATPPAGCSKVNQQVSTRNTASLNPQNFLECGNDAGNNSILGNSQWTNDRVIAITAAEWADAIAGPVADRLQRQVAPALEDWRTTESIANWGISFLPYGSTLSGDPAANDLCGNNGKGEGMPPFAQAATSSCTSWSSPSIAKTGGSGIWFPLSCSSASTITCVFFYWGGTLRVQLNASAPNVAGSFRAPITASDVGIATSDPMSPGALSSYSLTLSSATGYAALSATIDFPNSSFAFVTVTINHLPDAAILADSRVSWFLQNNWQRYTYYAISAAASVNPGASVCAAAGDPACLTLNGLPASNGSASDKRLVLALMGPRPTGTELWPSLESMTHTAPSQIYAASTVTSMMNDRLAACPFQQTPASGTSIAICN